MRNEHSEEEKCVDRAGGVEKGKFTARVKSFKFGKLNNYQLFNVRFPLHNSALDSPLPYTSKQEGHKNNGQTHGASLNCEATYVHKKKG
jgi:hypothetical protein